MFFAVKTAMEIIIYKYTYSDEIWKFQAELIVSLRTIEVISIVVYYRSNQLYETVQNILKAASAYMLKLSDKWVRDAIPKASV